MPTKPHAVVRPPPDPADLVMVKDELDQLRSKGYGRLVDLLLSDPQAIYAVSGRINKSYVARKLGTRDTVVTQMLKAARDGKKNEFSGTS